MPHTDTRTRRRWIHVHVSAAQILFGRCCSRRRRRCGADLSCNDSYCKAEPGIIEVKVPCPRSRWLQVSVDVASSLLTLCRSVILLSISAPANRQLLSLSLLLRRLIRVISGCAAASCDSALWSIRSATCHLRLAHETGPQIVLPIAAANAPHNFGFRSRR